MDMGYRAGTHLMLLPPLPAPTYPAQGLSELEICESTLTLHLTSTALLQHSATRDTDINKTSFLQPPFSQALRMQITLMSEAFRNQPQPPAANPDSDQGHDQRLAGLGLGWFTDVFPSTF